MGVVSSGDPGIYGMASIVLQLLEAMPEADRPEVVVVPGLSAVNAAARRKPMARTHARPAATLERHLAPVCDHCWSCGRALWVTDTHRRTVTTLAGLVACTLQIRSCPNRACERYRCPYHPEAEGALAIARELFDMILRRLPKDVAP